MSEFMQNSVFWGVALSFVAYGIGMLLQKKFRLAIFNPLLISVILIMLFLNISKTDYKVYQEGADVMFNSGLLYEYSVLKKHIEPLLMAVEETSPYYSDVLRLKELTDRFLPLEETVVPLNSILREFIGGGCFKV